MDQAEPLIRNISDTARWAAVYRARETERQDALFRDPFARRWGPVAIVLGPLAYLVFRKLKAAAGNGMQKA